MLYSINKDFILALNFQPIASRNILKRVGNTVFGFFREYGS
jgi:hypothetical protein